MQKPIELVMFVWGMGIVVKGLFMDCPKSVTSFSRLRKGDDKDVLEA